jgi:hypothetical protein
MTRASVQFSLWCEVMDGTSCRTSRIAMHKIPDLRQFKVAQLWIYEILKSKKNDIITFLKGEQNFSLWV